MIRLRVLHIDFKQKLSHLGDLLCLGYLRQPCYRAERYLEKLTLNWVFVLFIYATLILLESRKTRTEITIWVFILFILYGLSNWRWKKLLWEVQNDIITSWNSKGLPYIPTMWSWQNEIIAPRTPKSKQIYISEIFKSCFLTWKWHGIWKCANKIWTNEEVEKDYNHASSSIENDWWKQVKEG